MPKNDKVSISVIRRLPRYYRYLGELLQKEVNRISSRELAQLMNLTASQIRQDLNCFGGFGQQGYGYNVAMLRDEIGSILGINNNHKTIIIGVGNLGKAVATYVNFEKLGFELIGAFDIDPSIHGTAVRGVTVTTPDNIKDFCEKNSPSVAILCIPRLAAKEIVSDLIEYGIKGFWNFSQYEIRLEHEDVVVENVHLADSMMTLSYRVSTLKQS